MAALAAVGLAADFATLTEALTDRAFDAALATGFVLALAPFVVRVAVAEARTAGVRAADVLAAADVAAAACVAPSGRSPFACRSGIRETPVRPGESGRGRVHGQPTAISGSTPMRIPAEPLSSASSVVRIPAGTATPRGRHPCIRILLRLRAGRSLVRRAVVSRRVGRRAAVSLLVAVLAVVGIGAVASGRLFTSPAASTSPSGAPTGSPVAVGPTPSGETSPTPSGDASPTPTPSPTPVPTPVMVAAPLDGLLTTPAKAKLHPVAVMIDDLSPARPQSGFSSASVVWQAPAEGGIPRYMLVFQENTPTDVGPVRSSRYYYIAWAAELKALYVHAGGSPQALSTLRAQGSGQLVYNADQFAWGAYFRRVTFRFPPHNLYTTGKQLRQLAAKRGATSDAAAAVWKFAPDAPLEARPQGGRIEVDYPANVIVYKYDRTTNTYPRYVTGSAKQQVDGATKIAVAPKNVVIMRMKFGPLTSDPETYKHRLEAQVVGTGTAWISTNGVTIQGTWRKKSLTAPTLFYDKSGNQVTLTAGQTFVQVMKTSDIVKVKDGTVPVGTSPSPSASPSPSPSAFGGSRIVAA